MSRLVLLLALCVGCAGYTGGARPVTPLELEQDGWTRASVPVVRQRGLSDCGLAVAAMVVGRWHGAREGAQFLAARPEPERTMRAVEVRDLLRHRGLRAFVIEGRFADLAHEVREGRPVIVGTIKPRSDGKAYRHYEVVVAVHQDGRVATVDPSLGWRQYSRGDFAKEWAAARHTTIVVLPD